jgi:hypothetical protein
MDILEFYACLKSAKERERLEAMIFSFLHSAFDGSKQWIAEAEQELDHFHKNKKSAHPFGVDPAIVTREQQQKVLEGLIDDAEADHRDFLAILIELANGSVGPDYLINWTALDKIRVARQERLQTDGKPQLRVIAGGRRGRRANVRPIVVQGIRERIAAGDYTLEQLRNREVTLDSMAAEFNCSRTAIRSALLEILGDGWDESAD